MKHISLSTLSIVIALALVLAACSPAANPTTPPAVKVSVMPVNPEPSPTATEPPPPPPCTIAFESNRDGNLEIYSMDSTGGSLLNLTNNNADDWEPAWSADGSRIAFVSNRENSLGGGQLVYVMDADGSHVRQLTAMHGESPDWSHDGSLITFSGNENDNWDVYVINADGSGEAVNLTNSPEQDSFPAWSPDGNRIAWLSGDEGKQNIFVMDSDGSNVQQLTREGSVHGASWSVDGQIFTIWESAEHGCCNFVLSADGTSVTPAGGKGEIQKYLPYWTLEGDRVELIQGNHLTGDEEIMLVGEIYPDIFLNLTNNPAMDRNPDWPANCGPVSVP